MLEVVQLLLGCLAILAVLAGITRYYGQRPLTSAERFQALGRQFAATAHLVGAAFIGVAREAIRAAVEFEEAMSRAIAVIEGSDE